MKKFLIVFSWLFIFTCYADWKNGMQIITENDVAKFSFGTEWIYVPGKPSANWEKSYSDGIKFKLNNNFVNLDNVSGKKGNAYDQGVVYNRLIAEKDGVIILGMVVDWWFEAYMNGEMVYTTYPDGNDLTNYSYLNHQFIVPVKKGENLLAVKVQRGDYSFFFGAGEVRNFPFVRYKQYTPPKLSDKDSWTMVMLPDTQSYVKFSRNHGICDLMFSFIAENVKKLNIQQVIHVGDLVEQNRSLETGDFGNQTAPQQWQTISNMFKRLDNVVPYIITTGNHDLGYVSSEDRQSELGKYFPTDRNSKWKNTLCSIGANYFGEYTLENAAYEFTTPNGQKLLVAAIGFAPTEAQLEWAKNLFNQPKYKNHFGIIVTHSYMYGGNKGRIKSEMDYEINKFDSNAGEAIWQKLVKVTPNIRMVLCGHVAGPNDWTASVGYQVSVNDAGKKVHEIVFNPQAMGGGWYGNGGDGYIRLMEFDKDMKTVKVRTFSPLFAISPATQHLAWHDEDFNNFEINLEE